MAARKFSATWRSGAVKVLLVAEIRHDLNPWRKFAMAEKIAVAEIRHGEKISPWRKIAMAEKIAMTEKIIHYTFHLIQEAKLQGRCSGSRQALDLIFSCVKLILELNFTFLNFTFND